MIAPLKRSQLDPAHPLHYLQRCLVPHALGGLGPLTLGSPLASYQQLVAGSEHKKGAADASPFFHGVRA